MSLISETYGNDYQQQIHNSQIAHCIKVYSVNIANRCFDTHLDSKALWSGDNIVPDYTQRLMKSIVNQNSNFVVKNLKKNSKKNMSMVPYFIEGPVEYFMIIDKEKERIYIIYVTPYLSAPF